MAKANDIYKIKLKIKEIMAALLNTTADLIDTDKNFIELGVNSVIAVELMESLINCFELELGIEAVFDYKNIEELSVHILDKLKDKKPPIRKNARKKESLLQREMSEKNFENSLETDIPGELQQIACSLLDIKSEAFDMETDFIGNGINSVMAVEFIEAVNQRLGIDLGIEAIFDFGGIKALSAHITEKYGTCFGIQSIEESGAHNLHKNEESNKEIMEAPPLLNTGNLEDIAIIGISGRFPGAEDVEEFWSRLLEGKSSIGEINRKGFQEYNDTYNLHKEELVSKLGGMLDNIDRFDAGFFNISGEEAERMDPQQRLFMEEAFKAFENGGYSMEQLSGKKIGVFVGARASDYKAKILSNTAVDENIFLGNEMSILASRISYFLNLKGPSLVVDTACSSSLVAIHLACESIRKGESEAALAGGVFLFVSPEFFRMSSKAGMLSPKGTCKTFDNSADGMVLGEGVGALVLKSLEGARKDGDYIYGVIKGSAVNQAGKTNGMTSPSMLSQKELILEAYKNAKVDVETISYIEAHGTGTMLGDYIEVKALNEAFGSLTNKTGFCAIGSYKPNMGHATLAAGMGSIFKILMAMKYEKLPGTIGINKVNEHMNFNNSPFFINTDNIEWKRNDTFPLRAGVNAFGSNGTNCHIVLEEAPRVRLIEDCKKKEFYFFVFSAKSMSALTKKLKDMAGWLERESNKQSSEEVSETLLIGRSHFLVRCGFIANNLESLRQEICDVISTGKSENYFISSEKQSNSVDTAIAEQGNRLLAEIQDGSGIKEEANGEKLSWLAKLYTEGYNLDWNKLFREGKQFRVPLPSYPFDDERYWIHREEISPVYSVPVLHPLVHRNTSCFSKLCFTSEFSGMEFFFRDHVVMERRLMPGAASLEMIRAAFEAALEAGADIRKCLKFKNVVWVRPIIADERPLKLSISLFREAENEYSFDIYRKEGTIGGGNISCCRGRVLIGAAVNTQYLDLQTLRSKCSMVEIDSARCYEIFRKLGIHYGPGHKGIAKVCLGKEEALACLSLPASIADTKEQYVLHPSLMDSAMQAAMILAYYQADEILEKPALAFALNEMTFSGSFSSEIWAHIRNVRGTDTDKSTNKFDTDLYSDSGELLVSMRELTFKCTEGPLKSEDEQIQTAPDDKIFDAVKKILAGFAADILSVRDEDINMCADLQEHGFDLVKLTELINRLNNEYQLELTGKVFTQQRSLESLALFLAEEYGTSFKKASDINERKPSELKGGLQIRGLDGLLCRLMLGQMQSMGLFREKEVLLQNIIRKAAFGHWYDKWLEESIRILDRHNLLEYDEGTCQIKNPICIDLDFEWVEWNIKKEEMLKDPDRKAQVLLVDATLRSLPGILTRKIPATSIMFPNSSMELVEGIFKNNSLTDYYNEVLAEAAACYVQEHIKADASHDIRILEIGAGTGGTSEMIFKKLKEYSSYIKEYCYTDVSKAFLLHAQKKYGLENPYLIYKLFNIEQPALQQGVEEGVYDIVIATNVLHATRDIRTTLRNTKAIMKDNGKLLLNEINGTSLFTHLTFGLLEGWWQYEDTKLRIPGCPGLSSETWKQLLEAESFQNVVFPVEKSHEFGQQIIISVSENKTDSSTRENSRKMYCVQNHVISQDKISVSCVKNTNDSILEAFIKDTISRELTKGLNIEKDIINNDQSFRDYGVDSITGVNLVETLNAALAVNLDITCLFDYSSLNQLTKYLMAEFKEAVAAKWTLQTGSKDALTSEAAKDRLSSAETVIEKTVAGIVSGRLKEADPIAIVGMSGRFAKSNNVEELWKHLESGDDLIEEASRWDFTEKFFQDKRNYCYNGSFLSDIKEFDPAFFNISGREAAYMDPQQRLFLEEAWNALEDAGYVGENIQGSLCGVYAGCRRGEYPLVFDDNPPAQAFWGNEGSVVPARISYFLDLQGPAIAVDTACSSSLVAIHLACQELLSQKVNMALAGGIFISTPDFYGYSNRAEMLSQRGKCYTFDERADGFVPGEGVGVVVLKRLKDAFADGDHIYGVIRGSAVNQDGTTNGITAPSANSQERLECQVYDTFNINPENIQMVELHGTGTKLGDPIEFKALSKAFRKYTNQKGFCALGSVKSNLGHAVTAAGVAGIIKILLSLKNMKIPPSLNFCTPNTNIALEDSAFYVNTDIKEWSVKPGEKRRAAISSFGFSGTNVHMVLEEAPIVERFHPEKPGYMFVLSARTPGELCKQAENMVKHFKGGQNVDSGDLSYTLLLGRRHFGNRLACVVESVNEFDELLRKWLDKEYIPQVYISELQENGVREQPSLKRFGNSCIQNCQRNIGADEYMEYLMTVAELYIQGYSLDYSNLFENGLYARLSLPTYPFTRKEYWVNGGKIKGTNAERINAEGTKAVETDNSVISQAPIEPLKLTKLPERIEQKVVEQNSKIILKPLYEYSANIEKRDRVAERPEKLYSDETPLLFQVNVPAVSKETKTEVLSEELALSLAAILDISPGEVFLNKKFIDMGMDSIIGVEWIKSVNTRYGTGIKATRIYDYPTVHEFAAYLGKELAQNGPAVPVQIAGELINLKQPISLETLAGELTLSLAQVLGNSMEEIELNKKFIDMGMDSIISVEWVQAVNRQYGLSIKATKVYDYPCVAEFAGYLQKELAKQEKASKLSMDDMLKQVLDGSLDIEDAEELINKISET